MKRVACQDVSGSDYSLYQLLVGAIVPLPSPLSCFPGISPFPALMKSGERKRKVREAFLGREKGGRAFPTTAIITSTISRTYKIITQPVWIDTSRLLFLQHFEVKGQIRLGATLLPLLHRRHLTFLHDPPPRWLFTEKSPLPVAFSGPCEWHRHFYVC